jgi:hypothetical protein
MKKLVRQIKYISQNSGIPMSISKIIDHEDIDLNRSDQHNTNLAYGDILGESVLFFSYEGDLTTRALIIKSKIEKIINDKPIVFVVTQLSANDRRKCLEYGLSFITSDGEMFLPFIGTRLLPRSTGDDKVVIKNFFGPAEQRLALTIMIVQLIFERRNDANSISELRPFSIDGDRFILVGGKKFIEGVGKKISIKNRVTFNRAVSSLANRGLLNYIGETSDRRYSCLFNSQQFYRKIEKYLLSPIQESGDLVLPDIPHLITGFHPLFSGLTGLAKVTMITDDNVTQDYVINRSEREALDYWADNQNSHQEIKCKFQVSKYDLRGFNWLIRKVLSYPNNVIDPFHLYTIFKNDNDDRILGEAEELVDRIWLGDFDMKGD